MFVFNKLIFEKVLLRVGRVVKIFSISNKFFLKLVYYCMSLKYILIKSIKVYQKQKGWN